MKIIKLSLIFLFIISCGYSPIYQGNQEVNFKINKIIYNGDTKINKKIAKNFESLSEKDSKNVYNLELISKMTTNALTKDEKGNVSSFKVTINIDLLLSNTLNKKKISKKFEKEETYNSMDNKFELSQYRSNIEDRILSQISKEILIFLNQVDNDF